MTNEQIIIKGIQAHLKLTDDQVATMLQDGTFPVFHTYEHWKSLGFQVKKGEHADLKLSIWKQGKAKEAEDGSTIPGRMFMKTAAFFGVGQVEKAGACEVHC